MNEGIQPKNKPDKYSWAREKEPAVLERVNPVVILDLDHYNELMKLAKEATILTEENERYRALLSSLKDIAGMTTNLHTVVSSALDRAEKE